MKIKVKLSSKRLKRLEESSEVLIKLVLDLEKKMSVQSEKIQQLVAEVKENRSVVASAVAAMEGMKVIISQAQVANQAQDAAAVDEALLMLQESTDLLAGAIVENTKSDPANTVALSIDHISAANSALDQSENGVEGALASAAIVETVAVEVVPEIVPEIVATEIVEIPAAEIPAEASAPVIDAPQATVAIPLTDVEVPVDVTDAV